MVQKWNKTKNCENRINFLRAAKTLLMSIQTLYAHWNNNKVIIYESFYNVNHIALVFEEVNDKEIQLRNSLKRSRHLFWVQNFICTALQKILLKILTVANTIKNINITILTQQLYTGIYYQNCFTNLTLSNE